MLVDTNSAGTGISTCVKIGNTTNRDAGIGNGVFGEGANLLEHPLGCANPLTHENFIRTPFPPSSTL